MEAKNCTVFSHRISQNVLIVLDWNYVLLAKTISQYVLSEWLPDIESSGMRPWF